MNKKQLAKLKRLIRAHTDAQVALSWKGGQHPDDWDDIEAEAKTAKDKLFVFLKEMKVD